MARLRASLGNIHEVACLTGAFVSPLRFSVMTRGRSNGRCPFCHHQHGSKEHVLWNCPARFQVPNKPNNLVEFELGWPLSRNQSQVVQHMAKVRAEALHPVGLHRSGGGTLSLGAVRRCLRSKSMKRRRLGGTWNEPSAEPFGSPRQTCPRQPERGTRKSPKPILPRKLYYG